MTKLDTQHSQNTHNNAPLAGCHPKHEPSQEVQTISSQVAASTTAAIDDGENDSDYWPNGDACIVIARGESPTPCK